MQHPTPRRPPHNSSPRGLNVLFPQTQGGPQPPKTDSLHWSLLQPNLSHPGSPPPRRPRETQTPCTHFSSYSGPAGCSLTHTCVFHNRLKCKHPCVAWNSQVFVWFQTEGGPVWMSRPAASLQERRRTVGLFPSVLGLYLVTGYERLMKQGQMR